MSTFNNFTEKFLRIYPCCNDTDFLYNGNFYITTLKSGANNSHVISTSNINCTFLSVFIVTCKR